MRIEKGQNVSFKSKVTIVDKVDKDTFKAIRPLIHTLKHDFGNPESTSRIRMLKDELVIFVNHPSGYGRPEYDITIEEDLLGGLKKAVSSAVNKVKESTIKALSSKNKREII